MGACAAGGSTRKQAEAQHASLAKRCQHSAAAARGIERERGVTWKAEGPLPQRPNTASTTAATSASLASRGSCWL